MAGRLLAVLAPTALVLGQQDDVTLLQAKVQPADSPNALYRQPLINFGDAQYVTYMTMGRQMITGMVDTGSSELVVFGAGCSTCGPAAHYNSRLSTTFSEGKLQTQQHFGSGRTFCTSGQEEISIGPFHSPNQTFWSAESADMPVLENAAFEAVIGLGPPENPMIKAWKVAVDMVQLLTDTYDMGELAPRRLIDEARTAINVAKSVTAGAPMLRSLNISSFSICLGAKPGSNGVLVWNDKLAEEQPELFSKVPVSGNATWSVNLTEATISGRRGSFDVPCGGACTALLDTGSSLLAVPRSVKEQIQEAMDDLDENCSNLDVLPSLHLKFGEVPVALTPDTYVAKVSGTQGKTARTLFERLPTMRTGGRGCQLMLMESDDIAESEEHPLWVLGVPFFRKYYATFTLGASTDERAVHIAPHADDCELQQPRPSLLLTGLEAHTLEAERIRLPRAAAASVPKPRQ